MSCEILWNCDALVASENTVHRMKHHAFSVHPQKAIQHQVRTCQLVPDTVQKFFDTRMLDMLILDNATGNHSLHSDCKSASEY